MLSALNMEATSSSEQAARYFNPKTKVKFSALSKIPILTLYTCKHMICITGNELCVLQMFVKIINLHKYLYICIRVPRCLCIEIKYFGARFIVNEYAVTSVLKISFDFKRCYTLIIR